jgi:TolA-binding protein
MFSFIKMIPILLIVGGLAYGAHWFIVNEKDNRINQLQSNVDQLTMNNVSLQAAAAQNEATIRSMESQMAAQVAQIGALSEVNNQIQKERDEYLSIFRRHDMTRLARARPGLIENRINEGTKEAFRQIEEDSRELRVLNEKSIEN